MRLPDILRPYAALLHGGMGGFNGQTVGYVSGLTPAQVQAWYAGPMAEASRGVGGTPEPAESRGDTGLTLAGFRLQFDAPQYAGMSDEWWAERYAEFERNRVENGG